MMYDINFLPKSYLRAKARRRRQISEVAVVIAVSAAVAIMFINSRQSVHVLSKQAADLEMFAAQAQKTIDELAAMKKREQRVKRNLDLQRRLMQPIDHSDVLTTLTSLASESIALTNIDVTTHRPKPEAWQDPSKKQDGKRGQGKKKDDRPELNHLAIIIEGVAAKDDEVADFFGALSAHPVFEQVKMQSVLPVEFGRRSGRQFRLTMQVPLNRKYESVGSQENPDTEVVANESGGVADAN